jgi:putative endonuclease
MIFKNRPKAVLSTGQFIEQQASQWLRQQGLQLVANNVHSPFGEIDLIMRDQQQLIFVEVRFRKSAKYGSAAESVTVSKQQKIVKTAQHFLQRQPRLANLACRFDVIAAHPGSSDATLCFDWIKNAF